MINVNEARELVNNYTIEFPTNWKEQMIASAETSIRNAARCAIKHCVVKGEVNAQNGGYGRFYLNPDQFNEIVAEIRKQGFLVDEDFRIRYDGRPLEVTVYWV